MKNLLEGIDLPVSNERIGEVTKTLTERLKALREVYEIEQAPARALLHALQSRCDHPGAKRGYNERDGSWMSQCPICGKSE